MGTERTRNRWIQVVAGLFCLLQVAFAGAAEVPEIIHYEGYLTNTQGVPLADGNYSLTFNIYDTATGVSALWTESWTNQPVSRGRFRVFLGSKTPLTAAFFQQNPSTYLGITVGTDTEMLPRQRIASVPYALSTPGSAIPAGGIIMWSGAISAIPNGWALCDGNNGTPDLRNQFVVGAGSTYIIGAKGGAATVNIQHNHTITAEAPGTNVTGEHGHHILQDLYAHIGDTTDGAQDGDKDVGCENHGHRLEADTWAAGAHSHTVNSHAHGGATGNAGSTTLENRPPYYALAYIMKL